MLILRAERTGHRSHGISLRCVARHSHDQKLSEIVIELHSDYTSPLSHRLPLNFPIPCVFDRQSGMCLSRLDQTNIHCKLLQVYKDLNLALVTSWTSASKYVTVESMELNSSKDARMPELLQLCSSDLLFIDGSDAGTVWNMWHRYTPAHTMQRVVPCACDPDWFLLHASLNRDSAGRPVYYNPPSLACTEMKFVCDMRKILRYNAISRVGWIRQHRLLEYALELSSLTGLQLADVLDPRATTLADAMLERTWMENAATLPRLSSSSFADAVPTTFEGATVLEAELGAHANVLHVDARSLYPSVTIEFNLNPLVQTLFERLLQARIAEKDSVKAAAIKIITNSVFGSRVHGRYRNVQLARDIAERGRFVLNESVRRLTTQLPETHVIGGDTDSLFIKLPDDNSVCAQQVLDVLNAGWTRISFKPENHFSLLLLLNKKCWLGQDSSGRMHAKGLETNKSVTCAAASELHTEWQRAILSGQLTDNEGFLAEATSWFESLNDDTHSELCIRPKPNKAHPNTHRAYFYCTQTRGCNQTADYWTIMSLLEDCDPIDVQKLFALQVRAPLTRYWQTIFVNTQ